MKKDNKTVAITLRFWTDNLNVNNGSVACWDSGAVIMEKNVTKGIKPTMVIFQCPEDIFPAIKEVFRINKVLVVSNSRRPRVLSHRRRSK